MKKGRCGTMTHDYKRHGTTTLFAALDVLEGRVIGQCMARHRHQEFIRFLNKINRETPAGLELHLMDRRSRRHHRKGPARETGVRVDPLDRMPDAMGIRRQTVEHPFGTLKAWMGATHFLTRTLDKVRTEMSLHVLAYNLKRMIAIFGAGPLIAAIRT